MTDTTFHVDIVPKDAPDGGKIKLVFEGKELDCDLYDDWTLAGSLLRGLTKDIIPEGNFTLWHRWSLQADRDPISRTNAFGVWERLAGVEVATLNITARFWPTTHIGNGVPRTKSAFDAENIAYEPGELVFPICDKSNYPVLADNARNAVAQALDLYTDERCGQLYITDVVLLQSTLVELIEAKSRG